MKHPQTGTCKLCGGDWDLGNRDSPAYNDCTCDEEPGYDEDYERMAAQSRGDDFQATSGRDWT